MLNRPAVGRTFWLSIIPSSLAWIGKRLRMMPSLGQGRRVDGRRWLNVGSSILVAIREQPVRQVWVGFESSTFATTSKDCVIFWTNVFDWLGQGGDEFVSEPVQLIGDEWKLQTPALPGVDLSPGIYKRSDGAMRALNATDIRLNPLPQSDWQTHLNAKSITKTAGFDTRPVFLLLALLLVLASAVFWKPLAA